MSEEIDHRETCANCYRIIGTRYDHCTDPETCSPLWQWVRDAPWGVGEVMRQEIVEHEGTCRALYKALALLADARKPEGKTGHEWDERRRELLHGTKWAPGFTEAREAVDALDNVLAEDET